MRRPLSALAFLLAASGCRPEPVPAPAPAGGNASAAGAADSISLQRTLCYGTCPAYRVMLTRGGEVRFRSLNPGDTLRTASDRITPEAFAALEDEAERIGFGELPAELRGSPLCGGSTTDHPSVLVTVFSGPAFHRVVDDLGCMKTPAALRAFEARIDSVAGSQRWARPSSRR